MGFGFLSRPDQFATYLVTVLMLLTTGVSNVCVETFFQKMVPSDISGTMKGVFNFFGQLGVLTITVASGYLFDNVGPASPFILVGIFDLVLAMVSIILSAMGKITSNGHI